MSARPPAPDAGDGSSPEEVIGVVGHDLRSPLTSVLGYVQLLNTHPLTEEQRRYVEVIERNGRRLLRLVDELLLGAEFTLGQLAVHPADLDLARVARECGTEFDRVAHAAGVTLTVVAPDPVPVSGDHALLTQAMGSLLGRAIALTPRGGTVTLTAGTRDGAAVAEVADTGPGLEPDDLARLVARLDRVRPGDRQVLGPGLGLPVVRAVAAVHGGTLAVDAAPEQGTRVVLSLPAPGSS